jgi:hypothetical protein
MTNSELTRLEDLVVAFGLAAAELDKLESDPKHPYNREGADEQKVALYVLKLTHLYNEAREYLIKEMQRIKDDRRTAKLRAELDAIGALPPMAAPSGRTLEPVSEAPQLPTRVLPAIIEASKPQSPEPPDGAGAFWMQSDKVGKRNIYHVWHTQSRYRVASFDYHKTAKAFVESASDIAERLGDDISSAEYLSELKALRSRMELNERPRK